MPQLNMLNDIYMKKFYFSKWDSNWFIAGYQNLHLKKGRRVAYKSFITKFPEMLEKSLLLLMYVGSNTLYHGLYYLAIPIPITHIESGIKLSLYAHTTNLPIHF